MLFEYVFNFYDYFDDYLCYSILYLNVIISSVLYTAALSKCEASSNFN